MTFPTYLTILLILTYILISTCGILFTVVIVFCQRAKDFVCSKPKKMAEKALKEHAQIPKGAAKKRCA
jgi:Flp pilus assembly protein protease CpaA